MWLIGPFYSNITKPVLVLRMVVRKFFSVWADRPGDRTSTAHGLERCRIVYINLASRPDRKTQIEKEFRLLGVRNYERFDAIARDRGITGCNLSHAAVLSTENFLDELVMVCEDDAKFLVSREDIDQAIELFFSKEWLDVLCLGNVVENKAIRIDEHFAISNNVQTTSCYLVRRKHLALISSVFLKSAHKLERGSPVWLYASDIAWKSLQRWRLTFAVPLKTMVVQRPSFSDIQQREVDYFADDSSSI